MNSKTTLKMMKTALGSAFTFGALAFALGSANAQATFASYGVPGYANPYGVSIYGDGGLGGFSAVGGNGASFGSPLGGFFGLPLGGDLSFVGGQHSSGYAVLGPNGATFVDPFRQNAQDNQNLSLPNNRSANNAKNPSHGSNAISGSDADNSVPLPLSQSLAVRRGRDFALSIGWRGDPNIIANVTVTLLNRYHLPVAQQVTAGAVPAHFAANRNTFAARYYRVEVEYVDGAMAAITNPLTSATR